MRVRKLLQEKFLLAAEWLELFIAACIILMIVAINISLLAGYIAQPIDLGQESLLGDFLQKMLSFAVGVEFVKMLVRHTPGSVIDVLIFATSRQMIVEHMIGFETLLGIAAIGGLFAIQKFLLPGARWRHNAGKKPGQS